jgi:hypothetical protein
VVRVFNDRYRDLYAILVIKKYKVQCASASVKAPIIEERRVSMKLSIQ